MRKAILVAAALALAPMVPAVAQTIPQFTTGQVQGQIPGQAGPEVPLYLGQPVVREIQLELSRVGFNPGMITGVWDAQTAAALQAFKASRGLEPTPVIDLATLVELGVPQRIWMSGLFGGRTGQFGTAQAFGYGAQHPGFAPQAFAFGGIQHPGFAQQPYGMQQPYGVQGYSPYGQGVGTQSFGISPLQQGISPWQQQSFGMQSPYAQQGIGAVGTPGVGM